MTTNFQTEIQQIKHTLHSSRFNDAAMQASALQSSGSLSKEEKIETMYLQAVALRYDHQLAKAYECLQRLIELAPEYARAYQEQGYCELANNNIETALQVFHKAVELNPALLATWQQIADLLKQQKHPNHPAAVNQLELLKALPKQVLAAMDLMYEGKLYKAEQVCRKFLQQHKHQPDAMCLLAEIGLKLKVFDDAEFLLESCVNLYPDNKQAKASYIYLLNRLGKFELCAKQAEQFLTQFKTEEPLTITVQATLANALVGLGKLEQGKDIYQSLLDVHPDRTGLHLQLGHTFKTMGKEQQAIDAYKLAYQQKPTFGDAYWSLANIKTYKFSEQELTLMQESLNHKTVTTEDSIHINFALGKAYEDSKDFELSFNYYAQGNELKKQSNGYDANKTTELIDQQIQHCNKELFKQRTNIGHSDPAPIFILGLPRAGSTLLEQILASHSQVDGTMELHNILGIALKLRGRIVNGEPQYPKNLWDLPEQQVKQLGEAFIRDTHSYRQGAPFFIDKMPNNFIHIGLIKLILPNAKIIDARREPMACCFSGFKQLFGEGQDFSYDLNDIAQYYRDYERLMAHWDEVFPNQILRMQHEDLVNNFEDEVKRLLDYCQLPFEQSCLEFYNTKRNIHTPSAQQVRQPISNKGLEQWRNYEPYLRTLSKEFR